MRHPLIILFCFSFLSIFVAQGQSENEKSKGDSFHRDGATEPENLAGDESFDGWGVSCVGCLTYLYRDRGCIQNRRQYCYVERKHRKEISEKQI